MAKVSVIIPTYNRAHFLAKAIQSALDQRVPDMEVVVVDDGSTDCTRDVILRFQQHLTSRQLVYVYQENAGATRAFNRGIAESTGDYISIMGSDDWYLEDGIVPLFKELESRPDIGAVWGGSIAGDSEGNATSEVRPWLSYPTLDAETWLFACPSVLQSSLIRRSWVLQVGGFDPEVVCLQDWDFGLRLAHAGCQMAWVEELVFFYRRHDMQITRDSRQVRDDYLTVLNKFFGQPDLTTGIEDLREPAYARAYIRGALRAYEAGQTEIGCQWVEKAIRCNVTLAEAGGRPVLRSILDRASELSLEEGFRLVDYFFRGLPPSISSLASRRNAALAAVQFSKIFDAYAAGRHESIKRQMIRGLTLDPTWLCNRGVLSILAHETMGGKFVRHLRSAVHSLNLRPSTRPRTAP